MPVVKHVVARWDDEARVWWAESDDIPGLATEAPTFDGLIERANAAIGELLAESDAGEPEVTVRYRAESDVRLELAAGHA